MLLVIPVAGLCSLFAMPLHAPSSLQEVRNAVEMLLTID